jgi:opacity protein-like surface antigen
MKKTMFSSLIVLVSFSAFSQHLSINAYGGYTFSDRINFGDAYAIINEGGIWGVSFEGVNARGTALELLYQYQKTTIPLFTQPGNVQENAGNDGAYISYLLLNFEQYLMSNPKVQPYGGLGLGAAFYKGNYDGSSAASKFAWDVKAGIKFNIVESVGIKIGAQLLGSPQVTGTSFYFGYPGYVYPYNTYATILQFAFTGGLVFTFGQK